MSKDSKEKQTRYVELDLFSEEKEDHLPQFGIRNSA